VIDLGIDESKSPDNPLLVVSAIVGNTSLMRKLDVEWKREFKASNVDYFHAQEHWNLKSKAYHGISTAEREALLNRLVLHLQRRFLFGASVILDEAEYRASASDRFRSQRGSPYGWGFQMLMVLIRTELIKQRRANQPVNILIEDGHANAKQVIGFIEQKKRLGDPRGLKIGSYGLGGKKDNPILQAADLLAFGVCEFHAKGQSDFASRVAPAKYRTKFLEYYSDRVSVELTKADIERRRDRPEVETSGAKPVSEMVMW
jgi:hypothetical protein